MHFELSMQLRLVVEWNTKSKLLGHNALLNIVHHLSMVLLSLVNVDSVALLIVYYCTVTQSKNDASKGQK